VIARSIRLLLASGFLAAVTHVAPVAERAALGITRVEDLAPEAIARPLGEIRSACRVGRLARRIEGQSESGDACGLREPSPDARAQPPGTLPNPALTPGAVRTADPADVCGDRSTRQYRHWSRARDDRILAEYRLPPGPHPSYEVDHLIPLDLGGADDDANLWTLVDKSGLQIRLANRASEARKGEHRHGIRQGRRLQKMTRRGVAPAAP
jgi:hypothetical protein